MRLFHRGNATLDLVLTELPDNPSTSVTNMAEILAAELIAKLCPERFDEEEPAVLLEHYPEERDRRGRLGRKETWDRVSFASWSPRKIWLGDQERVSLGEPDWRPLPADEVERLIGHLTD